MSESESESESIMLLLAARVSSKRGRGGALDTLAARLRLVMVACLYRNEHTMSHSYFTYTRDTEYTIHSHRIHSHTIHNTFTQYTE